MTTLTGRPGIKVKFGVKFPAKVVAVAPLHATMSGGVLTLSWSGTDILGGDCWVWQIKRALVDFGVFYDVDTAVPADPSETVAIVWSSGARPGMGDTPYAFIKTAPGWTRAQMPGLYTNAKLKYIRRNSGN